jgi:hypothetical protein
MNFPSCRKISQFLFKVIIQSLARLDISNPSPVAIQCDLEVCYGEAAAGELGKARHFRNGVGTDLLPAHTGLTAQWSLEFLK